MIKALLMFICCSSKSHYISDDYIRDSFKGAEYQMLIDEFNKHLIVKSVQELSKKYAEEKARYANEILNKVGDIMTSL